MADCIIIQCAHERTYYGHCSNNKCRNWWNRCPKHSLSADRGK